MEYPAFSGIKILLASKSPRRRALLKELGVKVEIVEPQHENEDFSASLKAHEIPLFLAQAFLSNKVKVKNIYSRNISHAQELASKVNAVAVPDLSILDPVDLIIICVTDSVISEVSNLFDTDAIVVHTSGSTKMDVLNKHQNHGVFYPFQTFSKDVSLDFNKVPVFIEANSEITILMLTQLALQITNKVRALNSDQRLELHLAAVFANNFSNHMYSIAHDIMAQANLPFELLSHLIEETAAKAVKTGNPLKIQTGPAIRKNYGIMAQHKEILANKPLWEKIYTFVSNSIMDSDKDKDGTF